MIRNKVEVIVVDSVFVFHECSSYRCSVEIMVGEVVHVDFYNWAKTIFSHIVMQLKGQITTLLDFKICNLQCGMRR